MPQTDVTAIAPPAPADLEQFLDGVGEENAADGEHRARRDLVFGLLALPVLFAGVVATLAWVVPVVTRWLSVVLAYVSFAPIG